MDITREDEIIKILQPKYRDKISGIKVQKESWWIGERHCGMKMRKALVFSNSNNGKDDCSVHKYETEDMSSLICVCPDCNYFRIIYPDYD